MLPPHPGPQPFPQQLETFHPQFSVGKKQRKYWKDLFREERNQPKGKKRMAPLEQRFGVSELPQRVHARLDESGKLKSRKLPGHFDLVKDCQLMELVQYSCTPWQEMMTLQLQGKRQRCWPVVRLFRRCGRGKNMFHVETTAWEGEGAWHARHSRGNARKETQRNNETATPVTSQGVFAEYGSYSGASKVNDAT